MHQKTVLLPGLLLSLAVAITATLIEFLLPFHLIGSAILALFIGLLINHIKPLPSFFAPGLNVSAKKVLKLAIILLGSSLSISMILTIGAMSLSVMVFTLITCFGGGFIIGKFLGLDWKISNLIAAGTGICGGSAIAAVAPVIKAKPADIAYAMSVTFIFDMAMIVLFPLMGNWLGLSDISFGLWAGTAVNDTSSVVATGYSFSESAGDFATMVKLTRTLAIIPTVLAFALIQSRIDYKNTGLTSHQGKISFMSIFPWFIAGFLVMAILNSFNVFNAPTQDLLKTFSRFLMIMALAAIGMKTNLKDLRQSGWKPFVFGFIISTLVVIVAYLVITLMPVTNV